MFKYSKRFNVLNFINLNLFRPPGNAVRQPDVYSGGDGSGRNFMLRISNFVLIYIRGVAQLGLARLPWEQEVAGSNPVAPTIFNCR